MKSPTAPCSATCSQTVMAAGATRICRRRGPGEREGGAEAARHAAVEIFVQRERLGTGHAVLSAREALARKDDDVIVVYADTPLVSTETLAKLREPLRRGAAVVSLGFDARDPTGYGRLIMAGDELLDIREHKDATEEERTITLCNGGLMALRGDVALSIIEKIGKENAKGEYYLTDAVALARQAGHQAAVVVVSEAEVHGVNDRSQLADAERMIQERLRHAAMLSGVTMVAPETVFLSHDTRLERDVIVEPHVVFGPGVVVEKGAVDPQFQPSRRRPYQSRRRDRAVRTPAARRFHGREGEGREISSRSRTRSSAPAPKSAI